MVGDFNTSKKKYIKSRKYFVKYLLFGVYLNMEIRACQMLKVLGMMFI